MSRIASLVFVSALAAVVSALAQEPADAPTPAVAVAINGEVFEATTRVPMAGAQIVLRYATSQIALQTATADINGSFRFSVSQVGEYLVEANTDGYLPGAAKVVIEEAGLANPDSGSVRSVTVLLARSIAIAGRVRDDTTKEGLPGLTVTALRITYRQGKRLFNPDRVGFTDDQGDFRLEQLSPGEYFIEIKQFPPGPILPGRQADYTAESRLPSRYPQTIWPGDALDPDARPLTATSSGEINVGNLDLARVEPGRIRGVVTAPDCAEPATYSLSLEQNFGSRIVEQRDATFPCGSPFTIPNLSPGNYRIHAQTAVLVEQTLSVIRIEPGADRDLRLKLAERGVLNGSIIYECKGDCPAKKNGEVLLRPIFGMSGSAGRVQDDNTFRLIAPGDGPVQAIVNPLPEGVYVKRLLYNGVDVGPTFIPNPPAEGETLQIVLSDQAAVLTGIVTRDGKSEADAHVVIARSPLVLEDGWPDCTWVAVNRDGSFALRGLAPGRYLVASVGAAEWARWNMPGVAAATMSAGSEITLAEAESKTIILK